MTEHEIESLIASKDLKGDYAEGFRAALHHVYQKQLENYKYCRNFLSDREIQVLSLCYLPSKLIADKLNISTHTINSHFSHMRRKMNFVDKKDMVRFATNTGIIKLDQAPEVFKRKK